MKIIKLYIWTIVAIGLSCNIFPLENVRIKNIKTKSEFSLLLQTLRERGGAREPISREDVEEVLRRLTGEKLAELQEAYVLQANQEILFEIVMAKMPEIALSLQGGRDITSLDILKKFNEMSGTSVELEGAFLEDLLLNFKAEIFSEKKEEHIIAVLTGRQLFMVTKDLVNNKVQNITEVVVKDRVRALFDVDVVMQKPELLTDRVKKLYGEICMMYGFLRIEMLLQILQKTLKSEIVYPDIEAAYYDMFGVRLKYLDDALKSWFVSVVNYKYREQLQYHISEKELKNLAALFLEGEVVDYEDIQRQFLQQTKGNKLGKLLSLSQIEQERVVDVTNQELAYKGLPEERLATLMNFLERYSCTQEVLTDIKNSTKYVMKSGIDRVINAQRAKKCIEQNGWDLLSVADKCLACKKRDCIVIATRVHAQSVPVFSFDEVKQLVAFTEATGYQDWGVLIKNGYSANVLRDISSGKLVFIDTEDKSFEVFFAETKFDCVEMFLGSMRHLMTPDAIRWVEERLKYLKDHDEEVVILPRNSIYDPADMSFLKVKEEAERLYKSALAKS